MEANNSKAMYDAAALREALEAAHRTLKLIYENAAEFIQPHLADEIIHTGSAIAALAAPPRNCDVGTAEEQFERWRALCDKYDADCKGCPCDDGRTCSLAYCFARWAQMPYEEGEIR